MDLAEFIDTYREAIAARVVETYPPRYRPAEQRPELPPLLRRPMGGQADTIAGTALALKSQRSATVVGEMGTGKSFIGAAAAVMAGFRRPLVLCPPHLTRKWKREIEMTVPGVRAVIVKSISDLESLRAADPSVTLFTIMSRERAKLSYRWQAAVVRRPARRGGRLVRHGETGERMEGIYCPECYTLLVDEDGMLLTEADLSRRKRGCEKCGGPLWQADRSGPKRYALADYIKLRMKKFFDLLIADEVHEYKGRGSAQGVAAGVLASACGKTLSLSGTLMGGYASTLFHLLYRFRPEIRTEFAHNEEGRWVSRYGFVERTVRHGDEAIEDGRASRRRRYRTQIRERPGLAPAALFHLIDHTVFLRLADVAEGLPPYEEKVMLSPMDSLPDAAQAESYEKLYNTLRAALVAELSRGSSRLLGVYLQSLLAYPDGCTRGETVLDPDTREVMVALPPLSEDRVYPKEQALLDLIAGERLAGRRVLVYVTHTATRDITGRLQDMLERHGIRSAVLKSDTVPPDRREVWVDGQVASGIDVLICHPRLVQTGLDLIDFPTLVWFEVDYSVYTMRQASRRSWRIGQRQPVQVVYMAYAGTIQADALQLVAKKLQSSLAVEGELPEGGLAAYGDTGDDLMLALARKIVDGGGMGAVAENIFGAARAAELDDEQLLVDADWRPVEVAASTQRVADGGAAEPGRKVISWAEFMAQEPEPAGERRRARKAGRAPEGPSLFDWAVKQERSDPITQARLAAVA